jgi:hypothetical protein
MIRSQRKARPRPSSLMPPVELKKIGNTIVRTWIATPASTAPGQTSASVERRFGTRT